MVLVIELDHEEELKHNSGGDEPSDIGIETIRDDGGIARENAFFDEALRHANTESNEFGH